MGTKEIVKVPADKVNGPILGMRAEFTGCLLGDTHDFSGWEDFYNSDEEREDPECNPCGGEAICIKCGMSAMQHMMMGL